MKIVNKRDFAKKKIVGATSIWSVLEYYGLALNGVHAQRLKLFFGGEAAFQVSGDPFVGKALVTLNQGGIRNYAFNKDEKEEIKTALSTILSEFGMDIKTISGDVVLNYHDGGLQDITIQ